MIFKIESPNAQGPGMPVSLCCPNCRRQGVFEGISATDLWEANSRTMFGQRRCPNPECRTHIFFVLQNGKIVASYPAEKIDFDTVNLPASVVAAFEEAITCHANQCYIAGAIMVRKTLEELCRDRNAKGANLKERIRALGSKVVLPQELLDGLDDLRLFGNDAAHIESQEFAKEVLKAVYQYSALLARLRGLRKSP
jgi:hypothetical protein